MDDTAEVGRLSLKNFETLEDLRHAPNSNGAILEFRRYVVNIARSEGKGATCAAVVVAGLFVYLLANLWGKELEHVTGLGRRGGLWLGGE